MELGWNGGWGSIKSFIKIGVQEKSFFLEGRRKFFPYSSRRKCRGKCVMNVLNSISEMYLQ